jgi:hypothetical protein
MRTEKLVIFTRDDLVRGRERYTLKKIQFHDFRCDPNTLKESSIMVFTEDDGTMKVLKDRLEIISKSINRKQIITNINITPKQVYKLALEVVEFNDVQVKSKWRKRELIYTKAAISIVMRNMFGFGMNKNNLSLVQIGDFLGHMSHSNILAYWKKHQQEEEVINRVDRMTKNVELYLSKQK